MVSQDWLQRFLFNAVILVGGAWAVYRGQEFLMQLFAGQEVKSTSESNNVLGGGMKKKIMGAFSFGGDSKDSKKSGNDNGGGNEG